MVIGILQFELLIHGAESLKDKRRVVNSVKDRFHREHLVSIAEVDGLDNPSIAVMGMAIVGREGRHIGETLDRITAKLRQLGGAELGDTSRQILHGFTEASHHRQQGKNKGPDQGQDQHPTSLAPRAGLPLQDRDIDAEMLRRAEEADRSPREAMP
ncbi:MAG: DUF503 domain-containing protein [Phycisphaeraceae bacterium]|nr:DUF503 domain-containing protein [Phycisphaerae bacterium]MBX3393073.1 DUF503 domain-containing protein [Phycisphaeraceae bacterium]HRJ49314.1 DUF503 domain-containing protein [Phycisphaerales bacterium]